MRIEVEVQATKGLDSKQIKSAVDKGLKKGALRVERTAKELVPVDTGDLRNSITHRNVGDLEYEVKPTVGNPGYAVYIEEGTRPHPIDPVNAKALYWEGLDHPVPHVNHPGNAPYKYMEEALLQNVEEIISDILNEMRNV